jgi:hypothetical protein
MIQMYKKLTSSSHAKFFPKNKVGTFSTLCIFVTHKKNSLLIPNSFGVGKSGHHRAAKRITSVGREIRTSATESMYINL